IEDARRAYADEIRAVSDIKSTALIEGLARVPREVFVGPGPWLIVRPFVMMPRPAGAPLTIDQTYRKTPDADPRHLYHDVLVALDPERKLNNGQPSANISWIDALEPRPGDRVRHVGCGVGYYTAVLAEAVGPKGRVLAIEYDEGLAARARANLAAWPNVTVVHGDGAMLDTGPFDVGYINAGATRLMPAWLAGLEPGGRLHVPLTVDRPHGGGGFMLLVRHSGERWPARFTSGVGIYPCTSARDAESEAVLTAGFKALAMTKVQSLRRDAHEPDETCAIHLAEYCLSAQAAA